MMAAKGSTLEPAYLLKSAPFTTPTTPIQHVPIKGSWNPFLFQENQNVPPTSPYHIVYCRAYLDRRLTVS